MEETALDLQPVSLNVKVVLPSGSPCFMVYIEYLFLTPGLEIH